MKACRERPRETIQRLIVIIALAYATLIPEPLPAAGFKVGTPETLKFYCGDKIVAPGDSRANVLAKCGEPAWREMREEARTEAYLLNKTPVNFVTTEEWVYNFGSHQFLHFLRFQGDRLAEVETGGYGYDDRDFGRNCGNGRNISLGDRKLEVLVKCGEPMEGAGGGGALVESDEWTYNFGPESFMYFVKFRHGKVYDVRTGGYGR